MQKKKRNEQNFMNFQKKSASNFRILGRLSDYLQNRRRLSVLFSIVTKRKFLFFFN